MESIKVLLTYAIEEMEKTDYKWGAPGTYPEWPPLRQLDAIFTLFAKILSGKAAAITYQNCGT